MVALLPPGAVHLWLFRTSQLTPSAREGARSILDADERARSERFVFDRDRAAFIAGRAQLRLVLGLYSGTAPAQLTFSTNSYGKPALAGEAAAQDLRFNVSHTRTLVACAVTRRHEIGVDVEALGDPPFEIADRFFAAPEIAALALLPAAARPQAFYDTWTLKEAFIKARGVGLSMPLETFALQLDPPGLLRFGDVRTPERWWFHRTRSAPGHTIAICVEDPAPAPPAVTATWLSADALAAGHLNACEAAGVPP